jgi:hypothetical protein
MILFDFRRYESFYIFSTSRTKHTSLLLVGCFIIISNFVLIVLWESCHFSNAFFKSFNLKSINLLVREMRGVKDAFKVKPRYLPTSFP